MGGIRCRYEMARGSLKNGKAEAASNVSNL